MIVINPYTHLDMILKKTDSEYKLGEEVYLLYYAPKYININTSFSFICNRKSSVYDDHCTSAVVGLTENINYNLPRLFNKKYKIDNIIEDNDIDYQIESTHYSKKFIDDLNIGCVVHGTSDINTEISYHVRLNIVESKEKFLKPVKGTIRSTNIDNFGIYYTINCNSEKVIVLKGAKLNQRYSYRRKLSNIKKDGLRLILSLKNIERTITTDYEENLKNIIFKNKKDALKYSEYVTNFNLLANSMNKITGPANKFKRIYQYDKLRFRCTSYLN